MEYNTSQPIYLQVMDAIKRDIVTGKLQPGDKLPSIQIQSAVSTKNWKLKVSVSPDVGWVPL